MARVELARVRWVRMAMHPDVPDVVTASSVFGQIFLSRDADE